MSTRTDGDSISVCVVSITVEVPEPLASRLAAEAARRGVDPADLAVETLQHTLGASDNLEPEAGDPLDAFVGSFDFGDPAWASTDVAVLRAEAAARRPA